ncbi:hypothetical protein HII31_07589, partial [Pseudocercospora fuligena]
KGNLRSTSDSANESGVDESVTSKFPGAEVKIGSDGREIPVSEGGEILKETGQPTKASDFEGVGGPEDKARIAAETRGGDNDIRENIRQAGDTIRPGGGDSNNAAGGTGHGTA